MSKNSSKALYEQLMKWLPTLKNQRKRPVKSNNRQPNYSKADAYNQRKQVLENNG